MTTIREDYDRRWKPGDSPGRAAIEAHLAAVCGRPADSHLAVPPNRRMALGGSELLEGVSIWARPEAATPHRLHLGFGLSDLHHDPERAGQEFSGFGAELVMRVAAPAGDLAPETAPQWPAGLLAMLARAALDEPRVVAPPFVMLLPRPPAPEAAAVAALMILPDRELGTIATPHGALEFLAVVGLTAEEAAAVDAGRIAPAALAEALAGIGADQVLDPGRGVSAV